MKEIEIAGQTYSYGALPVRLRHPVFYRLRPVTKEICTAAARIESGAEVWEGIATFIDAVEKMSDADLDFVFDKCLAQVREKRGQRRLRIAHIDIATELRLTWEVLYATIIKLTPDAN